MEKEAAKKSDLWIKIEECFPTNLDSYRLAVYMTFDVDGRDGQKLHHIPHGFVAFHLYAQRLSPSP